MSENQRFNNILKYLIDAEIISYEKELAETMRAKPDRIKYLKSRGTLTNEEIELLADAFPEVNWWWVKSGQGSMLSVSEEQPLMVEEARGLYKKRPDHAEVLAEIIAGTSTLPIAERERILKMEVITLQQKILDIITEVDPFSWFKRKK